MLNIRTMLMLIGSGYVCQWRQREPDWGDARRPGTGYTIL